MDIRRQERQVCIYVGVGDCDVDVIVPSPTLVHKALLILHNISLMLVPILFHHHVWALIAFYQTFAITSNWAPRHKS